MTPTDVPWVELAVLLPLIGALLVRRAGDPRVRRLVATAVAGVVLLLTLGGWVAHAWAQPLASAVARGVFVIDESNAPLLPIVAVIVGVSLLTTRRTLHASAHVAEILLVEALLLATLSCTQRDLLLLLLALGVLPPLRDLKRNAAPRRPFALHAMAFVALLLSGWAVGHLAGAASGGAVVLLALAMLLRIGLLPGHAWIVQLYEHGSFAGAVLFTTPLVGVHGFLQLVHPFAGEPLLRTIEVVALVAAVVSVSLSLVQRDSRRFLAFLLLGHASLVLIGLDEFSPVGLTGALSLWISLMLSLTGLAFVLSCLEERVGRLGLDAHLGLYRHVPALAVFFLLTGLATIGFPGTPGFVGTELIVEGALVDSPLLAVGLVLCSALSGLAVLKAYLRLFTGCEHSATVDMGILRSERLVVSSLTLLLLAGGLVPQPGIASRHHVAQTLLAVRAAAGSTDQPTPPPGDPRSPPDRPGR